MTREEAHELLDAAKAGVPVSRAGITAALSATGDLAPCRRFSGPALPSQILPADPPRFYPVLVPRAPLPPSARYVALQNLRRWSCSGAYRP